MKYDELIVMMNNENFDLATVLEVKKYLPIETKKNIAYCILDECIENFDAPVRIDYFQEHLSYVKYMLTHYTNLDYVDADYDLLHVTFYNGTSLFDAIFNCFAQEAQECLKVLDLVTKSFMQDNSIEFAISKFLNSISTNVNNLVELLETKTEGFNIESILNEYFDVKKANEFLSKIK